METIKNAIGLGTAPQEGREPVSGVSGAGTAGEPYDQGNVEASTLGGKAPQHTDPSTDHSTTPNVVSTSDPAQDHTTTNALSSVSGGVTPNAASVTPATDSTPSTEAAASVGTTGAAANTSDPMHAHQDIPSEPATAGVGRTSGPPSHSLAGSKGSIAPEPVDHSNAPLKPAAKGGEHGVNPGAIPTAGGKKLGEEAYTERKSMQADSLSGAAGASSNLPTETSANTARNLGTAAPAVESDSVGRASTSSASGTGAALDKESSPSNTTTTSGNSGEKGHKKKPSIVEKIKDKVHKHKEEKNKD